MVDKYFDAVKNMLEDLEGHEKLLYLIYALSRGGKEGKCLFSLKPESKYKQYMKTGEVGEQLKKIFNDNKISLSNSASIYEINEKTWRINDRAGSYRIEDAKKELKIYKEVTIENINDIVNINRDFYNYEDFDFKYYNPHSHELIEILEGLVNEGLIEKKIEWEGLNDKGLDTDNKIGKKN